MALETAQDLLGTAENQHLLATAESISALVSYAMERHNDHVLLVPKQHGAGTMALSFEGQYSRYNSTFLSLGRTSTGGRVISVTASLPDQRPDHEGAVREVGFACFPDTAHDTASQRRMTANREYNSPLEVSVGKDVVAKMHGVRGHWREAITEPEERRPLEASLLDHLATIVKQEPLTVLGTVNQSRDRGLASIAQVAAWHAEMIPVEAPDLSTLERSPLLTGKRL